MKRQAGLLCLLLFAIPLRAVEPWFLQRPVDADTLIYVGFEGDAVEGSAGGELVLVDGAERVPGRFGTGVRLVTGKQNVVVKSTEGIVFGRHDPFTVELWLKPKDKRGGGLWSLATRYYLHVGSKGKFGYRAASFPIRFTGLHTLRLSPRRWSHVALTHDRQRTVRIYVDGKLVDQLQHADEGDYAKASQRLNVGSHDGWNHFLRGDVDEIRVSRGVRTFRPLLEQSILLSGEAVRLGIPVDKLPAAVATVVLSVRKGNEELHRVALSRAQLGGDLVSADELPPGRMTIALAFLDAGGEDLGTATATVDNAVERLPAMRGRLADLQEILRKRGAGTAVKSNPWADVLELYMRSISVRIEARKLDQAEERLQAADVVAGMIVSGEAAHRALLRRHVCAQPLPDEVRISMSWDGKPSAAFPWAERLGANELIGHGKATAERFKVWKDAGYHTVLLGGIPIHDHTWLKDHPENRQVGFWLSKPVTATETTVEIAFSPPTWGGYKVDRGDLRRWWKVLDSQDRVIPVERWSVDPKRSAVTLTGTTPGESYRVYYRIQAGGFLDPLAPRSQARALAHVEEALKPLQGVLDTFWADDIAYGWPGRNEQGGYDWESYTMAAGPTQVAAFEAETGIAFDPAWLVWTAKTIDSVPDPRYLKWMGWLRDRLKPFIAAHCKAITELGMRSWVYWGDCHVGMEPYGGSLEAFDEVDKPAADPVTARALTDFPGNTYRRMRSDWIFGSTGRDPGMPARHWQKWRRARRGLLRSPKVQGIYWMVFDNIASSPDADVRENMSEILAAINDEFRLLTVDIGDIEAFSHDIDVLVLSAWGDNYAWRPWGNRVLWHLTDLPVRVRFDSYLRVAREGVPETTDVVFLYGLPDTAWSGGDYWADGEVSAALATFVRAGGGLVALQAPGVVEDQWMISDVLGVEVAGNVGPAPIRINPSELADVADEGEELPPGQEGLRLTQAGAGHWLTRDIPRLIPGLRDTVPVRVTATNAVLVAARVGSEDRARTPGVVAREVQNGRVVYCCGNSSDDSFGRFIRNAIFWSAHAEDETDRLAVDRTGLFVYAYPTKRLLAVHNSYPEAVTTQLRCDPKILGLSAGQLCVLRDVVTGVEQQVAGVELVRGTQVTVPPNAVGLWRVDAANTGAR